MHSPSRTLRASVALVTLAATVVAPAPGRGGEFTDKVVRGLAAPFKARHRTPPATGVDCAVEQLANEIDWLENHIDRFGSIVPKQPDVWGQSRLTRHRHEYEEQLAKQLDGFQELNNASLARSDQSFLGLALAVGSTPTSGTAGPAGSVQSLMNVITSGSGVPIDRSQPFSVFSGTSTPFTNTFGLANDNRIGLEPTIHLDHLSTYLQHLQELRRINEGDDTADSPGYALNLVRIPVSILPGKYTQRGHGAEITVTADLQLGDELLPTTFRSLVVNDLIDSIAPGLTYCINNPQCREWSRLTLDPTSNAELAARTRSLDEEEAASRKALSDRRRNLAAVTQQLGPGGVRGGAAADGERRRLDAADAVAAAQQGLDTLLAAHAAERAGIRRRAHAPLQQLRRAVQNSVVISAPSGKTRRARLPLPLSQLCDVAGDRQIAELVAETYDALHGDLSNQPCIGYVDVRGFLSEELQAAYDFLALPSMQHVWAELPGWNLQELIRGRQAAAIEARRCAFFTSLGLDAPALELHDGNASPDAAIPGAAACGGRGSPCANESRCQPVCRTVTAILAWAILADSVLLNQRLVEDMQESASAKGFVGPAGGGWAGPFYGPNPSPEARRTFNDYVRVRWPIRIFALDPVSQEQNVEDIYSARRETQIAMALAASRGRAGAQAMSRYARRLETDLATITLNKTAVGFSHGSDTFGWRFYPRMQPPPTRNNIANFAETLCGSNSTTRDLAERRLEPGMRECTAIVVMPSFVPYVTFDVRTNWFSLTHPKNTDQSMRQTLALSRSVKAMQQSAAVCGRCAGAYRDGEVARLLRRVEQLDRELPLQTMLAQIPYENTSGGFELFNTGVTDLAPELIGWYGGTGVDLDRPTDIFVVGKSFSVLDSRVIAGGVEVKPELLSRQVMKITIPAGARPIRRPSAGNCLPPACAEQAAVSRRGASVPRPIVGIGRPSPVRRVANVETLPVPDARDNARSVLTLPTGPAAASASAADWADAEGAACPTPDCPGPPPAQPDECDRQCGQDCGSGDYVDIHLATPYGVSNHLLVPVVAPAAAPEPAAQATPAPAAGACGLALRDPVTLRLFSHENAAEKSWRLLEYYALEGADRQAIEIHAPATFFPPEKAELRFLLREKSLGSFATISIPAPPFDTRQGVYRLAGGQLRNFVGDGTAPARDATLRGALGPFIAFSKGKAGAFDVDVTLVTDRQEQPIEGRFSVVIADEPAAP